MSIKESDIVSNASVCSVHGLTAKVRYPDGSLHFYCCYPFRKAKKPRTVYSLKQPKYARAIVR